jgi:hypothetical protein
MIWAAWSLVFWLALCGIVWWLFFRNASNEFADGVEIDEAALEGDLRNAVRDINFEVRS